MTELGNIMKCLTEEQLNELILGSIDSETRLQELLHLEKCVECKARFTEGTAFATAANCIAGNVLDVDCPEYETLSQYLDGSIQAATAQKLAAHINSCEYCYTDLERMKSLRSHAVMRDEIVVEVKERAGKSVSPAWRWVFGTSMGAVAFAILMALMPTFQRVPAPNMVAKTPEPVPIINTLRNKPDAPKPATNHIATATAPKPVAPSTAKPKVLASKPDVVLSDGGLQIVRKDGKLVINMAGRGGSVEKLIASYVDQKLRTGKVKVTEPVQLAVLPKALRGAQGAYKPSAIAPKPSSPVGKVIVSAQPLLEWKAVDMAQDYQVTVTDLDGRVVYEAVTVKPRVKIDMPLDRGQIYAWRVASRFSDEGEWETSSAVAFKVISSEDVKLIDTARKQLAGSKLAMGAVYESLQLQDEARREYKSLAPRARGIDLLRSLNGK